MSVIRPATEDDLPALQQIEIAAGKPFAEIGMTAVAEDDPPALEILREAQQAGRVWVWTDDADPPIGYLMAELVDGDVHIDQVSVHPDHRGRRIGKQLIDHAVRWAKARGTQAMTLTTFTEVAWNGPYYERIGFRYLPDEEQTPGLHAIRDAEAAHGLDDWPRACMRADLDAWSFDETTSGS
ncbi:GNAT family N-acetyltransferase [Nocardia brasiliensis]